ncbi:hypothetical protein JN00_0546 [Metamycoplasma subdolum]|uniref:Uncharacterized protein n=1 Tax=Metamycoplasma subdolum TaxID=92407 RepID=A0A3L9ZYB2_9BACT|nr:hypothetical protein [Metamycoplasma subdolum]RMA77436.1 hypothetical protein JN00_0546 [Metamycoplasma subdolum]WPB50335.1 hypothetical protein R9C05_01865 [Metamycoplasma subdolum]
MNPELIQPEYYSVQEMYDKTKSKTLAPFISFLSILVIIISIYCAALIWLSVNYDYVTNEYRNYFSSQGVTGDLHTHIKLLLMRKTIVGSASLCFNVAIFIWFVVELSKTIRAKDFAKFSRILLSITWGYILLITFANLFQGFSFIKVKFDITSILLMTNTIIIMIGLTMSHIFVRRTVNKYMVLDAQIKIAQTQNDPNSIFNQFFGQFPNQNADQNNNENNKIGGIFAAAAASTQALHSAGSSYRMKLEMLSEEQLKTMAKKLNIFGAESFSKDQLVEKISQIFEESQPIKPEENKTELSNENLDDKNQDNDSNNLN